MPQHQRAAAVVRPRMRFLALKSRELTQMMETPTTPAAGSRWIASALASDTRNVLIITHSDLRAREIREEYSFYSRNTVLFPAKDLIFYQADLKGREIETERLRCLRRIMEGKPVCVVTTFSALMTPQIPLYALKEAVLEIGAPAEEVLTVKNVGTADQYARVTLYKYWTDGTGKRVDLDPAYIKLTLGEGWAIDKKASKWDDEKDAPAGERVVLYYTKSLKAGETPEKGEESTPLITAVTADSEIKLWVAKKDTTEDGVTTTTYIYKYDGLTLNLEASADAIQTHHAQEAVKASWGTTNVTINESAGTLSVAN